MISIYIYTDNIIMYVLVLSDVALSDVIKSKQHIQINTYDLALL